MHLIWKGHFKEKDFPCKYRAPDAFILPDVCNRKLNCPLSNMHRDSMASTKSEFFSIIGKLASFRRWRQWGSKEERAIKCPQLERLSLEPSLPEHYFPNQVLTRGFQNEIDPSNQGKRAGMSDASDASPASLFWCCTTKSRMPRALSPLHKCCRQIFHWQFGVSSSCRIHRHNEASTHIDGVPGRCNILFR